LEDNLGIVQPETGAQKMILAGGRIGTQPTKKVFLGGGGLLPADSKKLAKPPHLCRTLLIPPPEGEIGFLNLFILAILTNFYGRCTTVAPGCT
jgi:hypothetical protein